MSPLAARTHAPAIANDNGEESATRREMLEAALHLLVSHGLSAAREAGDRARAAAYAGDREGYRWWLGVCLALDRRLAHSIDESDRASA